MKKLINFLAASTVAFTLLLSSCSSDESDLIGGNPDNAPEIEHASFKFIYEDVLYDTEYFIIDGKCQMVDEKANEVYQKLMQADALEVRQSADGIIEFRDEVSEPDKESVDILIYDSSDPQLYANSGDVPPSAWYATKGTLTVYKDTGYGKKVTSFIIDEGYYTNGPLRLGNLSLYGCDQNISSIKLNFAARNVPASSATNKNDFQVIVYDDLNFFSRAVPKEFRCDYFDYGAFAANGYHKNFGYFNRYIPDGVGVYIDGTWNDKPRSIQMGFVRTTEKFPITF